MVGKSITATAKYLTIGKTLYVFAEIWLTLCHNKRQHINKQIFVRISYNPDGKIREGEIYFIYFE